jgi:putative ABC transport system permease protein
VGIRRKITHGMRTLLRREDADRDAADEVRHYLEEAEAHLVARGHSQEEARRLARLQYGDELAAREDVRAFGWDGWVESLMSDLRLSVRSLRRTPGFTVVVILTLGLGVGAATAILSAVRPILFEPLAYPHQERILSIADVGDGGPVPTTFGTYTEVVRRSRVFESLAVFQPWQPTLTGGTEPERLEGQSVSAAYFDVLGVHPVLGPGFDTAEDRPGGAREVVLSDALWRARFDADPTVVGRLVHLDGTPYTVVGVMPPGFENVTAPLAGVWTLLQYDPSLPGGFETREWGHHLGLIGRVLPGNTRETARKALGDIARQPLPDFPRPTWAAMDRGFSVGLLRDAAAADARPTMLVFAGAVALLLLVTCANLTLLLLARGARRRGEFAMRVALGAGTGRLARYLVTESLVLAAVGGLLGVGLARIGLSALLALSPPSLPRLDAVGLDGVALAFALGLTTVVGLVFGLAPGLHRSGGRPQALREAGRGSARRKSGTRRALVITEVALAMVLLVGAGLILRSTRRLFSQSLGLDPAKLVVVKVYGTGLEPGDAVTHRFFDGALDAVRAVPGVVSAAETTQLPLSGDLEVFGVSRADHVQVDGSDDGGAYRYAVSPGYFETMGMSVARGRALQEDDARPGTPVAVISRTLAANLFPDGDPIGARIQVGPTEPVPYTVVGVVNDVKQESLASPDASAVYTTPQQWHWADRVRWIVVKAAGDPVALVPAIRQAVWSVDPNQPAVRAQSMADVIARSESRRHFALTVVSAFALAAMTLAILGLYGVVSGMVVERMPELGVRAALGASNQRIVGLVVGQGLGLTVVGVGLGVAGAAAATRMLATFLFHVSRLDPLTYLAVASLLLAGSALACVVPAARAARVDPVRTLKSE